MILKTLLFIIFFIILWFAYPLTRSRANNFVTAPIVDFVLRVLFSSGLAYFGMILIFSS